jgi:hypothetical protein
LKEHLDQTGKSNLWQEQKARNSRLEGWAYGDEKLKVVIANDLERNWFSYKQGSFYLNVPLLEQLLQLVGFNAVRQHFTAGLLQSTLNGARGAIIVLENQVGIQHLVYAPTLPWQSTDRFWTYGQNVTLQELNAFMGNEATASYRLAAAFILAYRD